MLQYTFFYPIRGDQFFIVAFKGCQRDSDELQLGVIFYESVDQARFACSVGTCNSRASNIPVDDRTESGGIAFVCFSIGDRQEWFEQILITFNGVFSTQ